MRDKIRQAALRLFIDKGYSKTTIADIEREAGLAPRTGGFYRYYPGKVDLAVEIGETGIIETRKELGLDLLPLGDTRAELLLIAKGYWKAADRQAPLSGLIAEIRHLEKIKELERRVSRDLLEGITGWLSRKPFACEKNKNELAALTLMIFGGWLIYLSKRDSDIVPGFTDEFMLDNWAGYWAGVLDKLPSDT